MEIRNDRQKVLAKYKLLIIDEIGYLSTDIQEANLFSSKTYKISSAFFFIFTLTLTLPAALLNALQSGKRHSRSYAVSRKQF